MSGVADQESAISVERMQQVADDPALQQRLGEASLERVKFLGGWDQYGDLWDKLLHDLTGLPRDADEPAYIL